MKKSLFYLHIPLGEASDPVSILIQPEIFLKFWGLCTLGSAHVLCLHDASIITSKYWQQKQTNNSHINKNKVISDKTKCTEMRINGTDQKIKLR